MKSKDDAKKNLIVLAKRRESEKFKYSLLEFITFFLLKIMVLQQKVHNFFFEKYIS